MTQGIDYEKLWAAALSKRPAMLFWAAASEPVEWPQPGFIVGDWSVTYSAVSICHKCGAQNVTALCPDCLPPKRDVFPRQAMREGWGE